MLKSGLYKAEQDGNIFNYYKIIMEVKETEKSYTFNLIEFDRRYGATQMDDFFRKSKKVIIRKNKGGHAIRIWGEDNFTFYPYQAGVPFYFELIKQ